MAEEREKGGKGQWPLLPSSLFCCIHFSVMKPFPFSSSSKVCSTKLNWIYLWDNTCFSFLSSARVPGYSPLGGAGDRRVLRLP